MTDQKDSSPTIVDIPNDLQIIPIVDEEGKPSPGFGWKLSPEAEAMIREIEENLLRAAAMSHFIRIG